MGTVVARRVGPSRKEPRRRPSRSWSSYLWNKVVRKSWRRMLPAAARPDWKKWGDNRVTAAWLSHATVLINFYGLKIITDPVLFPRVGIRLPGLTIGPKRLTK